MVEPTPYMGTKRALAPKVRCLAATLPHGPALDVFAGMGTVAEALSDSRPVWLNDVQHYAAVFSRARFLSVAPKFEPGQLLDILSKRYSQNYNALAKLLKPAVLLETAVLSDNDNSRLISWRSERSELYRQKKSQQKLAHFHRAPPTTYQLFSISYADGYFTTRQTIEIDSIRAALDAACGKTISKSENDWLLLALARSIRKAAFTTGHFAQHLKVSEGTVERFRRLAKRSVWELFIDEAVGLQNLSVPHASPNNRIYRSNATTLLRRLKHSKLRPAIIYADPPYTADHYSRYYHIWESLVLYDYSLLTGKGRYRTDRFQTPYSFKARVCDAFCSFINAAHDLGASLILSYPANGLLAEVGASPFKLLKTQYSRVERTSIRYLHSTLGASNGNASSAVTEHIFVARL